MVSPSVPNTDSPISPRTRPSTSSSARPAPAASAARAVIRTFSPSQPLAKKAIVASPVRSSRAISPSRTSASPDSDRPQVRSTRLAITDLAPARSPRSESTSAIISRISHGTPGTA